MEFSLTQNAVIHISAGFDGPFILQVFGLRKQPTNPHILHMCLTDGEVYIGAKYSAPKFFDLQNYNIVRVTAQFLQKTQPITIKSLDILSKVQRKLIGHPPCTLQDFFNKEITKNEDPQPKKKIKQSPQDMISPKISENTQKIFFDNVISIKDDPLNSDSKKKKSNGTNGVNGNKIAKKLKLASDSDSDEKYKNQSSAQNNKIKDEHHPTIQQSPIFTGEMIENSQIRDLFQRHTGWVILCRVNYRSLAKCQNGLYAVNFVLVDETGDQIKCVYFQGSLQRAKQILRVGKYYLFAGGQIKETKERQLQIIFDRNSQIQDKDDIHFQVNPNKITRIDKIMEQEPQSQINVIGVVRKIKNKGQMLKTKRKFTATLCDPITNYQIDFLLFLNQDQKPIDKGMIIILHSYQVYRQNNICRLNSTYRSYYYQERIQQKEDLVKQNRTDLVSQFWSVIKESQWDNQNYKNISMFAFTQRNIHQLKNIYKTTQDDKVYSSVDCWVMQISKKKSYYACKICKKPTEKKQMGLFQCSHCKKMVDVILTYTLSVTFTDYTSSCMIDVIGEHAQNLLQKKALDFYSMPNDEQNMHLQSLRYKNVQLRLKSQKRSQGKQSHSVWGIQKGSPQSSLRQIRRIINQSKQRLDDQW